MAACEKRRSGLAPKTTQGPGTKTASSIFGMPNHQTPRAAALSTLVVWTVAACVPERCGRAGAGLRPASRPPIWLQGRPSNKKIQKVPSYLLPLKIRKWGMESTFVPFLKIRKWELRTLPSRLKWLIARQNGIFRSIQIFLPPFRLETCHTAHLPRRKRRLGNSHFQIHPPWGGL